ncbi:DUF4906 domain-containing protein [Xylanibacter oryzae]|uniref:DUF4906 domain-containing protein n=1 Tax=Xylanibacter oryzae TaxID=185293 RepID=UPI0004AF237A|nr:DUF4906 domain-containing protein [Xylanibacter oryzae]
MSKKNNVNRYKGYLLSFLILQLDLMLCFALFTSCATSQETTDKTQETTKINVCVKNKVPNDITRTVSDESINDINVFIFDNDGFLIGHKYSSGTSTYVDTRIANSCKVCVIANYGSDINNISTYNGLKKMITPEIGSATDISNKTTEIMYGEQSASISNTTSTISIILEHLYSKYTFTINPSSGVTITGYQLCHVSNISYLVEDGTMSNPSSAYLDFGSVISSSTSSFTTGQYYIYENYPGANKNNIGNAKDRNSLNAPSNASYLKITAKSTSNNNPWNSTYYVYLGGIKETDISDFNIPRDYNFSYTISITGSGYNDARVSFTAGLMTSTNNGQWNSGGNSTVASNFDGPVNIGEYYFSDGTWGTLADHATKTVWPIGIIFSNTTSSNDRGHTWVHGYAMALQTASKLIPWESANDGVVDNKDVSTNFPNTFDKMKLDIDGYTHCLSIKNYGGSNSKILSSSNYPAYYSALNFGNGTYGSTINAAPKTNNSGWFLPSIGQWYYFMLNLGKAVFTDNGTSGVSVQASSTIENSINTYINIAKTYNNTSETVYSISWNWCSSEYNVSITCDAAFSGDAVYIIGNLPKDYIDNMVVRSAIAF